ncbi:Hypothetical predicted protein, partial [Paramuricea clavata]
MFTTYLSTKITSIAMFTTYLSTKITSIAMFTTYLSTKITSIAMFTTYLSTKITSIAMFTTYVSMKITSIAMFTTYLSTKITSIATLTTCISRRRSSSWLETSEANEPRHSKANFEHKEVFVIVLQAVDDIRTLKIKPSGKLEQLEEYKTSGEKAEYLKLVRSFKDYGCVRFPHCECDARKNGHVIVSFNLDSVMLQGCTVEGELEDLTHTFAYEDFVHWDEDEEGMAFYFQYSRPGKKPRSVRILSPY